MMYSSSSFDLLKFFALNEQAKCFINRSWCKSDNILNSLLDIFCTTSLQPFCFA